MVVVENHQGDFALLGFVRISPPAGAADGREGAGGVEQGPCHVLGGVLVNEAIKHGVAEHFAGAGPEALVAGFGRDPAVGLGDEFAVALHQRPHDDRGAIAEREFETIVHGGI